MQSIKVKGVGTNPRIFDNGVIMGQMGLSFAYLTQAGWSHGFSTAEECFSTASAIEDARRKVDKMKKK